MIRSKNKYFNIFRHIFTVLPGISVSIVFPPISKIFLVISIAFISIVSLPFSSYSQEMLDEYLITAAQNNPGLQARFNEYMAAMEKVPQVGTLPDPVVAFGYFILPVETRVGAQQFKASVSQVFPWFGLLNAREDVATEIAKAKLELFEEQKSRLFYDVKTAYYNFYFMDKAIDITIENIDILNTFQQLALIKFEAGKASAVDELRVEMDIADLENELAYIRDGKREMQVQFNNLLNVSDISPINIPEILWNDDLLYERSALLDSIALQNHQIKQIEHRILSWQHQEKVARKTGLPNFIIGIDYTTVKKRDVTPEFTDNGNDALFARIGFTLPLYRRKYNAMVNEAVFEMNAADFEKTDRVNVLSTLFENGYKEYRDGNRRITLNKSQLVIAEKALDILLAEYSTDGQNFEEVLRMERKVLKYELELDKARADKNATYAFIYYLMGK